MDLPKVALAALAATLAAPALGAAPSIAGNWKTDDGKAIVSFYRCGAKLCGKVDRFLVPEPAGGLRDTKNPDADKRTRKVLGLNIFWGLSPDGSAYSGKGYSPQDGLYFNAEVSREGGRLKVKGCKLVFCKTRYFTPA